MAKRLAPSVGSRPPEREVTLPIATSLRTDAPLERHFHHDLPVIVSDDDHSAAIGFQTVSQCPPACLSLSVRQIWQLYTFLVENGHLTASDVKIVATHSEDPAFQYQDATLRILSPSKQLLTQMVIIC